MNIWQNSLKIMSLGAVVMVSLVCVSAIAQGCPGKKSQVLDSSPSGLTSKGSGLNAVRPGVDHSQTDSTDVLRSDSSTTGETWKLVAIGLATMGIGSTGFLIYKAWVSKKLAPMAAVTRPELEHPELQLTDLPKEALPDMADSFTLRDWQREAVLTR